MTKINMRSVTRDVQTMSLGLNRIVAEIERLSAIKKQDKSVRNRLARLQVAKKHLTESPEDSKKLMEQIK